MTHSIKDVLLENFRTEASAFVKALEAVPEERFAAAPAGGGHSPAWHALHIAEWTRMLLSDLGGEPARGPFAFLGWENAEWTKSLFGEGEAREDEGKPTVLFIVNRTFTQIAIDLGNLTEANFEPDAKLRTPLGERPLVTTVLGSVRHMAYHRGQIKLVARQDADLAGPS